MGAFRDIACVDTGEAEGTVCLVPAPVWKHGVKRVIAAFAIPDELRLGRYTR